MLLEHEILELATRHAFHIAREPAPAARRSVWVRLRDRDGLEGWGEAAPTPYYGETADTVRAALARYAEVLDREARALSAGDAANADQRREGSAPPVAAPPAAFALERIERALARELGGNPSARAALSAALHDLMGKRLGQPVWRVWGLDPAASPPSSFTIGIASPDTVRERVREAAGYPILKVKVGTDADEAVLAAIRDAAPEVLLRVDANTAWTAGEATDKLAMLEAYGVELLEQPLPADDLEGFRVLRRRSSIPIIADESCRVATDVPRLVGCVDGVNIKLAKCGSLREALRIVHAARAHHMEVMLGCMVETTLGISAAVQLAPLVDHLDLDGAALLANDPFHGPALGQDGRFRFNTSPGLGVTRAEAAQGTE